MRCHKLAYIALRKLLAQGSAAEVIAGQHLSTWAIHGERPRANCRTELRRQPGVEQTVTFGDVLHVSGTDADHAASARWKRLPARRTARRSRSTPASKMSSFT